MILSIVRMCLLFACSCNVCIWPARFVEDLRGSSCNILQNRIKDSHQDRLEGSRRVVSGSPSRLHSAKLTLTMEMPWKTRGHLHDRVFVSVCVVWLVRQQRVHLRPAAFGNFCALPCDSLNGREASRPRGTRPLLRVCTRFFSLVAAVSVVMHCIQELVYATTS
jgi:hypothetical protein